MISSLVNRTSAAVLAVAGFPLLFASDVVLPHLVPGLPVHASWLGQLLAAAWLSVAFYNWNTRDTILGGIYGRPAVLLNLGVYLISALSLIKGDVGSPLVRLGAIPCAVLAAVYALLLLRGPLDRPEV
ncbi:MAG: hypothetical protein K2Y26_07275 [Gemmatimonadaceae bacterium]|nr:hypothetical protein [Gemmatimonadaceae bacterium]